MKAEVYPQMKKKNPQKKTAERDLNVIFFG